MRKTNILIVDDRKENIDALSGLIVADDVEIFSALSAQEALRHLTEHEFGLALLDVQMPETTGFELARLLRGVRRYRHLPIIFVTAHQETQSVVFEGYDTGAVDFLFKPLDPHVVRTKVRVFVELNQQRNQLQEHVGELQRLRLEAEAANIAKSQFLANMSHEIRTPLAAVMGFADLLSKPEYSEAEKLEFVKSVKRNGDLLLTLIDDILDLSKIEANRIEFERIAFSLNDILKDVESTLSFKASTRGVTLVVHRPAGSAVRYFSDPTRVKQVILNIVGNAIKFSPKGRVEVTTEITSLDEDDPKKSRDLVRVRVKDNGVGMTVEQSQRLFQPFSQADASTRRRFGGSGLGLIISRQIASALEGDVQLVQTEPNEGSEFEIRFHLKRAVPAPAKPTENVAVPKASKAQNQFAGKSVLAVDDAPDNLTLIEMYLRATGVRLKCVEDGQSAIDELQKDKFDLVLMDVQMPGMDGHEATREIRKRGFEGPIIALTAHAILSERLKCKESGCTDTLTKPIARPDLIKELAKFL